MYQRVLLAYDGSREGRTALREGTLVARRFGAQIFLLCVVAETPGMWVGEAAFAGATLRARDISMELFESGMERLRQLGFEPEGPSSRASRPMRSAPTRASSAPTSWSWGTARRA